MKTRLQWLFLILAALGTVLPLLGFGPFLPANGLDPGSFLQQFLQTPVSRLFGFDVLISAVAFWLFVFHEGHRLKMNHLWVYVASTLLVGVSLGLPLFLFFRERQLAASLR